MSRYAIHPLDQSFYDWDRNRISRTLEIRRRVHAAYNDYEKNECHGYYEPNYNSFKYWAEKRYGIRVNILSNQLDGTYQIIDEHKHLLFQLKYA